MKTRSRICAATAAYLAALLVLGCTSAPAPKNDESERLAQFADGMEAKCRSKHESMQQLQKASGKPVSEFDRLTLEMLRTVECDCVPARVRVVVPQLARAKQANNKPEFDAVLFAQVKHCSIRSYREYVGRLCVALAGPAKRKACDCAVASTAKLDDDTVFTEIMATTKNFEQRAKDKSVPKYEGKMSAIEKTCGLAK